MMKRFFAPLIILLSVACNPLKVAFDYNAETDFSAFKTYKLTAEGLSEKVNELDRDRMLKAIDNELALKGFTKSDDPDALVVLHVITVETTTATATSHGGYGPYNISYGGDVTQIDYDQYTDGAMIINIIDASTDKAVWRGAGARMLAENASTDKKEANINNTVKSILKNYPPSK